jgi:hypothetical protein
MDFVETGPELELVNMDIDVSEKRDYQEFQFTSIVKLLN